MDYCPDRQFSIVQTFQSGFIQRSNFHNPALLMPDAEEYVRPLSLVCLWVPALCGQESRELSVPARGELYLGQRFPTEFPCFCVGSEFAVIPPLPRTDRAARLGWRRGL